jgi:anti-sigma regulatory factor (Ser/Thr protein kinase)
MTSLTAQVHVASVGHPAYSQTFPCEPSTAEIGRRLLRNVLGIWCLDSLADHAALIITELIANAARHTPCQEIRLLVERPSATRLRVGVLDREPARLPTLSQADADDESGRGLLLIDAVADRWGYDLHGSGRRPWGKEVWAELRIKDGA